MTTKITQFITASTPENEPSGKTAIFSLVCGAHFLNHFQSSMLGALYALMMRELGFGFIAMDAITAVYGSCAIFSQQKPAQIQKLRLTFMGRGAYSQIVRFLPRENKLINV